MRNSPVVTVDPTTMSAEVRRHVEAVARDATDHNTIDLTSLPVEVREQLLFALASIARGKKVAAIADGKALTTTEAADLLGMSRSHLTRLCKEGRIPSYKVGTSLRVSAETVMTILRERGRLRAEAGEAVATADERRRARAARAAGLG